MVAELGDGTYEVVVTDNREGGVVADLTPFVVRGRWNRALDSLSEGSVAVVSSPECCDHLNRLAVTRHDLGIVRNGEVVWQGPLVRMTSRGDLVEIDGRDVVWWLTRRFVREDYEMTEENPEVATDYLRKLIIDGMEPDDRGVIPNLVVQQGQLTTVRSLQANTRYVYDELADLSDIVIDYTTVGKTLYIADDLFDFGVVAFLADEHFRNAGELGVEVIEDGLQFATKAIFRGRGDDTIQTYDDSGGYYGLIETYVRDGRTRDGETGVAAARNAVGDGLPPVLVAGDGGAILNPNAPVGVNDLLAGALVRITLRNTCRTVDQTQRIEAVDANWDNTTLGESIGLRLGPTDTTRSGGFSRNNQ